MRFLIAVLASATFSSVCFASNLVSNGGFETGDFTGWVLSADPSFSFVSSDDPHSGQFAADFGEFPNDGFLTQVLPTVPGLTYALSYYLQNEGGTPNDFSASWDGVVIPGSQLTDADGTLYVLYVFAGLQATSSSTILQFAFEQSPAFWHLDDVVVQAVPEPSNWSFLWLTTVAFLVVHPRSGCRRILGLWMPLAVRRITVKRPW